MDKYDTLIETYGLKAILDMSDIDHAQVLRELNDNGLFDPNSFDFEDVEVGEDD